MVMYFVSQVFLFVIALMLFEWMNLFVRDALPPVPVSPVSQGQLVNLWLPIFRWIGIWAFCHTSTFFSDGSYFISANLLVFVRHTAVGPCLAKITVLFLCISKFIAISFADWTVFISWLNGISYISLHGSSNIISRNELVHIGSTTNGASFAKFTTAFCLCVTAHSCFLC